MSSKLILYHVTYYYRRFSHLFLCYIVYRVWKQQMESWYNIIRMILLCSHAHIPPPPPAPTHKYTMSCTHTNYTPPIHTNFNPLLSSLSLDGKNDGSVKGKRYFHCKSSHGLFVKPEKATHRGINCAKILPDSSLENST